MSASSKTEAKPDELKRFLDVEEQSALNTNWKVGLRALVVYGKKYRRIFYPAVALVFVYTAATLALPWVLGKAVDQGLLARSWRGLVPWIWATFLLESLRFLSNYGNNYLFAVMGQKILQDLRLDLFTHLQRLPLATYDRVPSGRLVTRVTNDVSSIGDLFTSGFVTAIGNVLVVLGILVSMIVLNWRVGLIASAGFPLLVFVSYHFSARLRLAYRDARSKLSALNAFLAESILGMRVLQLFQGQSSRMKRFEQLNDWYFQAQFSSVKVMALFRPSITLFMGVSTALTIYFGGGMSANGSLPLGVLVAFFAYVLGLFEPINELADKWNVFLSGMASTERIFSILSWPLEGGLEADLVEAPPYVDLRGELEFRNVWFAYEGERWILRDFSLKIPAGSMVGVVGATGSGKTTLISLLMRFYDPQRGQIFLDGRDLKTYDKRRLRASFGFVQQDVFLFSGSILENVSLFRDQFQAQARECLSSSEGVLESGRIQERELNERGMNLSMGQRQLVAFARAQVRNPRLWILDEATANVDSHSEKKVVELLDRSGVGKTRIIIAHRLATVRKANLIAVLSQGALLESGTHSALLKNDGLYARLMRVQEKVNLSLRKSVQNDGNPLN